LRVEIKTIARGLLLSGTRVLVAYCIGSTNTFLPGGHIEPGEKAEDTLKREFKEELGITITVKKYLGAVEQTFTELSKYHHGINHIFLVDSDNMSEQTESKEDHLDFFWVESNDTGKLNLFPSPLQDLIKRFIAGSNDIWWQSDMK